jgi:replicative DNA helicase
LTTQKFWIVYKQKFGFLHNHAYFYRLKTQKQMSQPRLFNGKTYVEVLEEGLQYVKDRRTGKIKSFKLPWIGLNKVGVGGLEWGSMLTIGARPGAGKTMFVSQILRESKILNPTQEFNILEFQFEMAPKQTASRDFAAQTGLDYNVILSTDFEVSEFAMNVINNYVNDCKNLQNEGVVRVQINEPLSYKDIEKAVYHYYNVLGGKPLIITIDHSWLIKKDKEDREKINTLYNTTEMLMQLKNKLPVIIVMITQLNRSIDEPHRKTPGSISNFPTSSDIFGGDALMQGSDMVLILNRPYKSDIPVYGPKEYICGKEDCFVHVIKTRNSSDDNNLLFMKFDFGKQKLQEVPEPAANNPSGNYQRRSRRNSATPDAGLEL